VALLATIAAGSAMAAGVQTVQEIKSHGVTFVRPAEWESVPSQFSNVTELRRTLPQAGGLTDARILIAVEVGRSHQEALVRLGDIALEREVEPTFLEIGGWPAIQRRVRLPLEKRQSIPVPESAGMYWRVTTAVAAGNRVLRMEGVVPDAFPLQVDEVEEIGRSSLFPSRGVPAEVDRAIEKLRSKVRRERSPAGRAPDDSDQGDHDAREGGPDQGRGDQGGGSVSDVVETFSAVEEQPQVIVRVNNSAGFPDSEIEVAISNDGRQIVLGNNADDFMFSNDFGANFSTGTIPTPMGFLSNGGDPSFAFAQSGTFYHAFIGFPDTDATATRDECATTVNRASVDPNTGVMTWAFRGNAVACNDNLPTAPATNCFPDQEHIAADPRNAAPAPGNDQLYSVYRHFGIPCSGTSGTTSASIVCSSDGGVTWTAPATINPAGGGDFPRLTVGPNGSVHVVYRVGNSIMYQRYNSCAAGLVAQHAMPITIRTSLAASAATCPIPGNDRCNAAFVSSHTVAVDNLDSTHVYVAYANTTVANTNDDIIVQDSRDSGATWPAARRVRINTASQARRFMPWMCSVRQDVYVGWYDRRNTTVADNSLTDYFVGTARFVDPNTPLGVGPDLRLSTASDSQCSSGWPCTPTPGSAEATSCTIQPQLAGICCSTGPLVGGACPAPPPPGAPAASDGAPCDYAGTGCTAATCRSGGRGCPKYGDYSGIACSASRVVGAWASATSPAGMMPASVDIDTFVDVLGKDLRVENLALSSASVAAGQQVTVSFKVFNRGRMSITEDWREAVSLRDPNVADPNIVIANLGTSHVHTARVNLAVSHSVSQAFTIPAATAPGNYAIRVRGDSTNAVAETDEMNDVSIPITILLGKDLDVRNLSVTPATSSPGATVTVAYEVENVGGAAVTEDWKESIQLRDPNGVLTSLGSSHLHTENLAPAGVHPSSKKVIIPAGAATGAFNIVVKTDSLGAIAEGNEANNEETAALALQAGTKDIVIQNLAVSPNPVASGGSLLVNYRIVNQGTITLTESFKENVILKAPGGAETLLGSSHVHTENLAPAGGHNASKSFTIPAGLAAGTYMIIVRGDSGGAVAESDETNNDGTINVQIQ